MRSKPTNAQINTLRRMFSGTKYSLRGDGKRGIERRLFLGSPNDITAASLPPLYRLGLIKFSSNKEREATRFYEVMLTEAGRALVDSKIIGFASR